MSDIVYTTQISVNEIQLRSFIPYLNRNRDDDNPITYEEIINNKKLLKYVCTEAVEDGVALFDPAEFWINGGWCDVEDYR